MNIERERKCGFGAAPALAGAALALQLAACLPPEEPNQAVPQTEPARAKPESSMRLTAEPVFSESSAALRRPSLEATEMAQPPSESPWNDESERHRQVEILMELAEVAPEEAAEKLEGIPELWREVIQFEVAASRLAEAPEDALFLVQDMSVSTRNDELLRQIAMELATEDPEQAFEWIGKQEDAETAQILLSGVLTAVAGSQPEQAARMAVESLNEGPLRDRTLGEIMLRWSVQSPEAAAEFLPEIDRNVALPSAVEVARRWYDQDPEEAGRWVSQLRDPVIQEAAAKSIRAREHLAAQGDEEAP